MEETTLDSWPVAACALCGHSATVHRATTPGCEATRALGLLCRCPGWLQMEYAPRPSKVAAVAARGEKSSPRRAFDTLGDEVDEQRRYEVAREVLVAFASQISPWKDPRSPDSVGQSRDEALEQARENAVAEAVVWAERLLRELKRRRWPDER